MNSTPNPTTGNPDAVLAARADERLAHAYEQIAHADEQLVRLTEQLSKMEHDAPRHPSAVPGLQPSRGRAALRGFVGLVLAACIGAAAFALQSSHGEEARLTLAQWAPNLIPASPQWVAAPANSAQPGSSTVQLASVDATPSQPVSSSQPAAQDVAPTPAPLAPELTQLLQTMAHDLAVVEQGIEQLKASQERMATDNAKAIEELKARQEQLTRVVAKPSDVKPSAAKPSEKPAEQDLRTGTTAPAPRPKTAANATHKPPPAQPSQGGAHSQPVQLQPKQQ
jgi:hypothetical protein